MREDLQLLRKGLWPLAALYGLATAFRNFTFDRGWRATHRVDVPVISVGNLAAGGTGKTPLVVWLVARALAQGRRPGVLARGYGRAPGAELNDEGMLLRRRFPDLPQVQDPDRVAGARRLVADHGVDLIILDDGFQHRRLHRDVDLVCLDTAHPFAGGVLPVGYLREFPAGLRRADALILTRAGAYADEAIEQRRQSLSKYTKEGARIFATEHRVARVRLLPDDEVVPLGDMRGRRVLLLSAIARPETFADTAAELGCEIVGHVVRRDHHIHTTGEMLDLARRAESLDAEVLTTEKDAVKIRDDVPRLVVELDLVFLGEEPEWSWSGKAT